MPLTRLDMVSMAPKTQEAGTYKHNELQQNVNQQSNIVQTVQQQARQNETQTVRSSKTENEADAKHGGNGSYSSSSGKKKEEQEKEEEQRKIMRGSTFDITV